jgi:hypothetical protein
MKEAIYEIGNDGSFIIKNYLSAKPFSSFLPGIAGMYGIPMWVFYVNRGQGIASFGLEEKDKAIVEFFSANRAYQLVPSIGFRTFIKINGSDYFEAFEKKPPAEEESATQTMRIYSSHLEIEEENHKDEIQTRVSYFTLPQDTVGALVRKVTIRNNSRQEKSLEILDGLPQIMASGLNNWVMKNMTYLAEAHASVENLAENKPFYKIPVSMQDSAEVELIKNGHFYFSKGQGQSNFAEMIVDPALIFGNNEAMTRPEGFLREKGFIVSSDQRVRNLFPCAFSLHHFSLKAGEERSFYSLCGSAKNREKFLDFAAKIGNLESYVERKFLENRELIAGIEGHVWTVSAEKRFDLYARQSYLDNVIRGGMPCVLDGGDSKKVFYTYSRKHGDLERDYNAFKVPPTYFSQGNGNYRDVNQNRRSDIVFYPELGKSLIQTFMNLIQLDGYNPLVIQGTRFLVQDEKALKEFLGKHTGNEQEKIFEFMKKSFSAGELLLWIEEQKVKLPISREEFIAKLLGFCEPYESAEHGEGFWTDHWAYNLDLLESYFAVFPEKGKELLLEDKSFTFYENYAHVAPRKDRYFLTQHGVRQYKSEVEDKAKKDRLLKREKNPFTVRTKWGEGEIYKTNLAAKLFVLALTKISNLDPFGVGIEFEANKPNWYDALNGMPGLFGSSVSETFELKRLLKMLSEMFKRFDISAETKVSIPREARVLFEELKRIFENKQLDDFSHWDQVNNAKEKYRADILKGMEGTLESVSIAEWEGFSSQSLSKIEKGLAKSMDPKTGLPFTYFIHEVLDFEKPEGSEPLSHVWPKAFRQKPLPLFLEGIVHAIRTEDDPERVREIHEKVLKSGLYDKNLKMFKVNDSLEGESLEIGRARVFQRGWLENESIWMHMEYKYLLELLKKGLAEEFFQIAKNVFPPFLEPKVYGRSIFENSSFIASSVFPDNENQGRGFYARLSGSTAEFVQMWLILTCGASPFILDEKKNLALRLAPILPGEFFIKEAQTVFLYDKKGQKQELNLEKGSFAFKFLSSIPVIYVNPDRKDTWKAAIKNIVLTDHAGKTVEIKGNTILSDLAAAVRNREIILIKAYF